MDKHLHIVCFDVPWPPDYGGVIDMFYRIKALHGNGVKIHLHCFDYGRGRHEILDQYCSSVHYYKRKTGLPGVSLSLPYIVSSRKNKQLLEYLRKDDHPILFEGIHTTGFINDLKNRKVFVRMHNAEYLYYNELSGHTSSLLKKIYYRFESRLLKKYEAGIAGKYSLLAISEKDRTDPVYAKANIHYLPAFIPYNKISIAEGMGNYCLYHGNLSVAENEKAVLWLIDLYDDMPLPLIIAGKDPGDDLVKACSLKKNISIIPDPSPAKMLQLIAGAQVNLLPFFIATGTKLKVLSVLFNGRHCLVNMETDNSMINQLCRIGKNENEFKSLIHQLIQKPFTKIESEQRKILLNEFDNDTNARKLMQWIW